MLSYPFKSLALACAIAALTACGGAEQSSLQTRDSANPAPENPQLATKDVSFRLDVSKALNAGVSATRAEVRVFNDLLERSSSADIADQAASISFTALPLGSYSIEVKVFDEDNLIATGTGSAQVNANDTTAVNLVVNPVTGNLDVAICMPDLATEYLHNSGSGTHSENSDQHYFSDNDQPAFQSFLASFDGLNGNLSYSYRIGDVALDEEGRSQLPQALYTDHGASLTISNDTGEVLNLSGCNTQVDVEVYDNEVALVFTMPESYIDQRKIGPAPGLVFMKFDGLAMVIRYSGNGAEAIPAGALRLADIDFSKFTQQRLYLAAPVSSPDMTEFELSQARIMVNSVFDQLNLGLYWSIVE